MSNPTTGIQQLTQSMLTEQAEMDANPQPFPDSAYVHTQPATPQPQPQVQPTAPTPQPQSLAQAIATAPVSNPPLQYLIPQPHDQGPPQPVFQPMAPAPQPQVQPTAPTPQPQLADEVGQVLGAILPAVIASVARQQPQPPTGPQRATTAPGQPVMMLPPVAQPQAAPAAPAAGVPQSVAENAALDAVSASLRHQLAMMVYN